MKYSGPIFAYSGGAMNVEEILKEFAVNAKKKVEFFEVLCPFHQDKNPSGSIHRKTGFFHCWVCQKRASLISYLVKYSNLPLFQVKTKVGFKTDCKNPVSPQEVEGYHIDIWNHPTFLHELHHRCITDEIIRKRRLGVKLLGSEKRIVIPIINDVGEYANLRLYLPGAAERKFLNLSGRDRSKKRFTPVEQLEYDQILVCGGELKAYAAAEVLNKYDIGAISPTCGENDWPHELTDRLAGKLVYVNCDVDKTGETYSELRCRIINTVARAVHKVVLTPEMVGNLEKGDLNDFLRLGGDLYKLILDTPEWKLVPGGEIIEETPEEKSFRDAYSHENVGKRTKFTAIVASINTDSYFAPSLVEVKCNRNEEFCSICDVNTQAMTNQIDGGLKGTEMKIGAEHPSLLALIGEKTEDHHKIYKQCFKIPTACKQCIFEAKKQYSVTEVRLDEELELTSRQEPMMMKAAYIVNSLNSIEQQTYNLTGRLYPSPKNQVSTYLISGLEPTEDALDAYQPDNVEYFHLFRPDSWDLKSLERKLDEIYSDLEANVTKIYQRRDYHIAVDLSYHSLLHLNMGDNKNINSYVETLIIGDTGQGKSEAVKLLQRHYGLGHKVDCKNITLAGLTIGLEKSVRKHFAVYGALPRNDKGLIIFEELKGMHPKVFQALTETRSSGFVQITKIDRKIRRARVRIIAISNPMDKREVASYTYGIEAAIGVIGTNEDLRRFDLVLIIGKNDIDSNLLTQQLRNPPVIEHKFTDELCQRLILKAWKCEEAIFEDVNQILEATKRLVNIFGDGPPVLDPNTSHLKVAKLSAAIAARTASYEDEKLIVRKCHVEFIEKYLTRIYSSPSCRLGDKSKSVRDSTLLRGRDELVKYLKSIQNAADIMLKVAEIDEMSLKFIQELCGDFYIGTSLFAKLIQSNAIVKTRGDKYVKTPEFTKLLNSIEFEIPRPDYIKEQF